MTMASRRVESAEKPTDAPTRPDARVQIPLVVDLDGTLLRSDLLIESAFAELGRSPTSIAAMIAALWQGKAALKALLAERQQLDPASLPYDQEILAYLRETMATGRPVYLASASHQTHVAKIASHLGLSGWFATDAAINLSAEAKARRLVEAFGPRGFDYIGNHAHDLPVWRSARNALGVRVPKRVASKFVGEGNRLEQIPSRHSTWRDWLKLLRVHQYAKNLLVFVPLLTSHQLSPAPILLASLAAVSFCFCASSFYIVNDIVDLKSDRDHPENSRRPLASGAISIKQALAAAALLFAAAVLIGLSVSITFLAVLLGYAVLTTAYSLWLKRKMIADVITLAALYSARIVGGAVAIGVTMSEWLLAFSVFMFTALALIKRYVELAKRLDMNKPDPANRNYQIGDLGILASLAAAAGFNAITVFALYISSNTVRELYRHPQMLWFICPVLIYWFARMLMMAHRRHMHHDPILFAVSDKVSLASLLVICALMAAAA